MTRRRVRRPWRWQVADVLRGLGWCWSDLVSWAMPPRRALRDVDRQSTCAREPATVARGVCYCGIVGAKSPGEQRRVARRARRASAARRVLTVLAVAAAIVAPAAAAQVPVEPGAPTFKREAGSLEPAVTSSPRGPGADLVARQIFDARGGTP